MKQTIKPLVILNIMQHPLVTAGVSFLVKLALLCAVVSFERVVGYPIIASYIFWSFSGRDMLPQQIVLISLFSFVLSGLYGLNILFIFGMLAAGQLLLSLGFFRKQKLLRIAASAGIIVIGFWVMGMTPSLMTLVYAFIQIVVLLVAQLRLGWYRRASW